MNLETYMSNPELLKSLTDTQKAEVYQQLITLLDTHTQEKVKITTELEMKKQQQQQLLEELKTLTGKTTVEEIQKFLITEQDAFDTLLLETIKNLDSIEKQLYGN